MFQRGKPNKILVWPCFDLLLDLYYFLNKFVNFFLLIIF